MLSTAPLAVLPFPDIDPVIFQIGPLAIRWYALAYVAGLLIGWRYMRRLNASHAQVVGDNDVDDFLTWATLGVILGGRIGYILFYNLPHYIDYPLQALAVWQGGMSFHGGLAGVVLALLLFARRRNIPVLSIADLTVCAVPIGLFFGRIANFINSELYGRVTDVPWAFVFPTGGPAPRHPSQLYEAALEGVLLFIVLAWLARRPGMFALQGMLSGVFLVGYSLSRMLVELVREPDAQIGFLAVGTTMGQWLSVPLLLGGIYLIWRSDSAPERNGQ